MKLPKDDRDYSMFTEYQAKLGAVAFESLEAKQGISVLSNTFEFNFEEPVYDFVDTNSTDYEVLYNYFHIKDIDIEIDVDKRLRMDGFGNQYTFVELQTTENFLEDDWLAVYFYLDLPADALPKGADVMQWGQLWPKSTANDDVIDYMQFACVTEAFNEDPESSYILNYAGSTSMNYNEEGVKDMPIDEMLVEQRIDWEQDGLWEKSQYDWGYSTYESWGIEGNMIQECIARLRLPKQGRDETFFQKYKLRVGSRIYYEDGTIKNLNAKGATVQLKEPDLDELEGLAEVDALLDDNSGGSADEQDESYVQLEAAESFTVDTSGLGLEGQAEQKLLAGFEIIPQVDMPDILNLYFSVDLDKSALQDGSIVYQWASFVQSGLTYGTDSVPTVVCKVTIGDEYGIEGLYYEGSNSFQSAAAGVTGQKWYEANAGDAVAEHGFYVRWEDSYLYELRDSPLSNNNKVQGCLLNAAFAKMKPDDPFYATYDVQLGTRIYNGDDDTEPLSIIETSFSLTLDPPSYADFDGLDPEEFNLEDVEYMYVNVFSNTTEYTAQGLGGDASATGNFTASVDLFINKELGLQDELQMTQTIIYPVVPLTTAGPTAALQSFISYVPVAGGDRHTVGCDYLASGAAYQVWSGSVDMSDDTTVSSLA